MKPFYFIINAILFILVSETVSAQGPGNDECGGAILINTVPFGPACSSSVSGSTLNATQSLPNPSCTSTENNDDVWYKFIANSQSVVLRFGTVTNLATGNEGVAGFAFYAACPGNTSTLACNNLGSAGVGYTILNNLTIGQTYFIRIWSVLTGFNAISFEFCVQDVPAAPINDECVNATLIPTQPEGTVCDSGITATTIGATHSTPDPPCQTAFSNDDIWFRFVANTNAVRFNFSDATLPLTSSPGNMSLTLYEGNCPTMTSGMVCISNAGTIHGSVLLGGLTPGSSYYLRLYSLAANNYMDFNFCLVDITLPQNDECINATQLNVTNGFCVSPIIGNLKNATVSPGFATPSCVGLLTGENLWYRVIIPASGSIVAQTTAINDDVNDLVMEAFVGSCGSLTSVGCDDDGNPDPGQATFHPRIELSGRTPGEIIFLRVVPKGTINRGPFAICAWDPTVLPPVSPGGNCIAIAPVIIDSAHANVYTRVPLFDANGNIVATIFPNGFSLGTMTTSLFVNQTGIPRSVNNHFYLDRNISITASGFGSFRVRLFVKDSELNALKAADPNVTSIKDLQINRTSTACQSLFSGPTVLIHQDTSVSYGVDHFVEFPTATFSSYYLAGGPGALPLRFISFEARSMQIGNQLKWTVEKDETIDKFLVEQSVDGRNFRTIHSISKNEFSGSSTGEWKYEYVDKANYYGNIYYRIAMLDIHGTMKYSSIQLVAIRSQITGGISIYPNPANQIIFIYSDKQYGLTNYAIYNSAGKQVKQGNLLLVQNGTQSFDISSFPLGNYWINIHGADGKQIQSIKFIKH